MIKLLVLQIVLLIKVLTQISLFKIITNVCIVLLFITNALHASMNLPQPQIAIIQKLNVFYVLVYIIYLKIIYLANPTAELVNININIIFINSYLFIDEFVDESNSNQCQPCSIIHRSCI